jgi:hypothetical protein
VSKSAVRAVIDMVVVVVRKGVGGCREECRMTRVSELVLVHHAFKVGEPAITCRLER